MTFLFLARHKINYSNCIVCFSRMKTYYGGKALSLFDEDLKFETPTYHFYKNNICFKRTPHCLTRGCSWYVGVAKLGVHLMRT